MRCRRSFARKNKRNECIFRCSNSDVICYISLFCIVTYIQILHAALYHKYLVSFNNSATQAYLKFTVRKIKMSSKLQFNLFKTVSCHLKCIIFFSKKCEMIISPVSGRSFSKFCYVRFAGYVWA